MEEKAANDYARDFSKPAFCKSFKKTGVRDGRTKTSVMVISPVFPIDIDRLE